MRSFYAFAALLLASPFVASETLPSKFIAHRVYLVAKTTRGEEVWFYVDSGGGGNMFCRDVATRLQLNVRPVHEPELEAELGKNVGETDWPTFDPHANVPPGVLEKNRLLVVDCPPAKEPPRDLGDAFLSSRWLDGRIWTWDYPAGELRLELPDFRAPKNAERIPIHFQTEKGKHVFAMARLTVRIGGAPVDLLLDTGAGTHLKPDALKTIADGLPSRRAASFIQASVFDLWHTAHPEWRVLENAEDFAGSRSATGAAMIEVPQIDIGHARVGPVWFTRRADSNFTGMMSSMTDQPVVGALGGNAFYHFVMTVDHPKAAAYFTCLEDCKP